jgi:Xaa-Pro aminopeptidase
MAKSSGGPGLPLLFYADGYKFPDVYHTTRFLAPDPIIALEGVEELVIVASSLEEGRARKESRATTIVNMNEYGAQELSGRGVAGTEFWATIMKRFLDERGIRRVAVAPYFPLAEADRLRELGIELVVANDLRERRRSKRPDEIEAIEAAQRATEDAWRDGVDAIRRAKARDSVRSSSPRSSSAGMPPMARSARPDRRPRIRTRSGAVRSTPASRS